VVDEDGFQTSISVVTSRPRKKERKKRKEKED
jgi:hypothetical protein